MDIFFFYASLMQAHLSLYCMYRTLITLIPEPFAPYPSAGKTTPPAAQSIMRRSLPKRDTDQQGSLVHHKKVVLDLSFPLLVIHPGCLGEPESPEHPAEQHTHLHQRQVLTRTDCRSVRKREERSRVVLPHRRTRTEPTFGEECLRRVEISRVTVNAIRVKGELRLLRNEAANAWYG